LALIFGLQFGDSLLDYDLSLAKQPPTDFRLQTELSSGGVESARSDSDDSGRAVGSSETIGLDLQ
jgi:hypothetical protein